MDKIFLDVTKDAQRLLAAHTELLRAVTSTFGQSALPPHPVFHADLRGPIQNLQNVIKPAFVQLTGSNVDTDLIEKSIYDSQPLRSPTSELIDVEASIRQPDYSADPFGITWDFDELDSQYFNNDWELDELEREIGLVEQAVASRMAE